MATGFAAGLRSGGALVSQALENERLDEASRRQGEEFDRKKVGWAREDATNKIVDENRQRLGGLATSGVIDDDQVRGLSTRYGVTPEQVQAAQAQPGGAAALFKTYEDSATAAGTPLTGGLPAPEVKSRAATAADYEREAERGALRLGDVAGARTARAAGRTAGVQETVDASTKRWAAMKPEEREAAAWAQNTNRSDLPVLTTEVGKNGMTIVGRDPRTGKADMKNPIKLSWADVSMMDAAQDLAAKGYGAEAIEMANKVDTRLGALVSEYNKQTVEMAKTNNDAAFKAGSLANDSARVGIARQSAERQANADKVANSKYFVDPKTGENYITMPTIGKGGIQVQTFKLNNDGSTGKPVPLPAGAKPVQSGSGGKETWTDAKAPGTVEVSSSGQRRRTDDDLQYIAGDAPLRSEVTKAMAEAGVTPEKVGGSVQRSGDGKWLLLGNDKYDPNSRQDMALLRAAVDQLADNNLIVEEGQRSSVYEHGDAMRRRAAENAGAAPPMELGLRTPGMLDPNRDRFRPIQTF